MDQQQRHNTDTKLFLAEELLAVSEYNKSSWDDFGMTFENRQTLVIQWWWLCNLSFRLTIDKGKHNSRELV